MELDDRLIKRFESLLAHDEAGAATPRLMHDARRLFARARVLTPAVGATQVDAVAVALACLALQLPMRTAEAFPIGRFGQINLRERAEQAAELLVTLFEPHVDPALLERATLLLTDLPQRTTRNESAKLLADAINLDDFGLTGLLNSAVLAATRGHGVDVIAEGQQKRDAYGYWDARLRDGFHHEPVRAIAQTRLRAARAALAALQDELARDTAG